MPSLSPSTFAPPIAVLNPGGRDSFLDYRDGPGPFQPGIHPPINFHAFAACSRGAFCQHTSEILQQHPGRFHHALLLLRHRLSPCLQAIRDLRAAGIHVWLSWKECGYSQVAAQLSQPSLWPAYAEIVSLAQGVLSPTGAPFPLPPHQKELPFHPLPTPYPIDVPTWDYSVPLPERSGIFLGTREFRQPSRNHLSAVTLALRAARATGTHVTVINSEKRLGQRWLKSLAAGLPPGCLRILEGRLRYDAYLQTMAQHRVVFQLDRSLVPGQVAGDALLCRTPCLGGNSAVEQIAFPRHSPPVLAETAMMDHLATLLTCDASWQEAVAQSQALAQEHLSFAAGARSLQRIFSESSRPAPAPVDGSRP